MFKLRASYAVWGFENLDLSGFNFSERSGKMRSLGLVFVAYIPVGSSEFLACAHATVCWCQGGKKRVP